MTDQPLTYGDVKLAADRVHGHVRPVVITPVDPGAIRPAPRDALGPRDDEPCQVWLALEYMQHTGSFKARGAVNFLRGHLEAGTLPDAGVTIASGGNAGLACAWAAKQQGATATVFLPASAPQVKVDKLHHYGAEVRLVEGEYADAANACTHFAGQSGALQSHAYADRLISAGAGTLVDEILAQIPDLDTIVVAVGGGGLFAGVAASAQHHGLQTIGVEPENCRALNAAVEAGHLVDVTVDSIAADSLGARRTSAMALHAARQDNTRSILVRDDTIITARQALWDHRRIAVEHGGAAGLAALLEPPKLTGVYPPVPSRGYRPGHGEKVCVVLCGANTDPTSLINHTEVG